MKKLAIALATMFAVALICARTTLFSYLEKSHYTICPFYNLFHRPCPSCGMTMGVLYTMRLEFHEAMLHNPLSPLVLLGSLLVFVYACLSLVVNVPALPPKSTSAIALLSSAVIVFVWITRFFPTL